MAELIVTGRIIQVLPPQGGTSKAGNPWRKQEYVLETTDNYPKKICFNFFNDRIDQNPIQLGDMINLQFDLESREYNGRWYTDVRGWRAEKVEAGQQNTNNWQQGVNNINQPGNMNLGPQALDSADDNDQLPF